MVQRKFILYCLIISFLLCLALGSLNLSKRKTTKRLRDIRLPLMSSNKKLLTSRNTRENIKPMQNKEKVKTLAYSILNDNKFKKEFSKVKTFEAKIKLDLTKLFGSKGSCSMREEHVTDLPTKATSNTNNISKTKYYLSSEEEYIKCYLSEDIDLNLEKFETFCKQMSK